MVFVHELLPKFERQEAESTQQRGWVDTHGTLPASLIACPLVREMAAGEL